MNHIDAPRGDHLRAALGFDCVDQKPVAFHNRRDMLLPGSNGHDGLVQMEIVQLDSVGVEREGSCLLRRGARRCEHVHITSGRHPISLSTTHTLSSGGCSAPEPDSPTARR